MEKRKVVVTVSGGFDPIHIGHIEMLKLARSLGDHLIVILNNDNWLTDKKGFSFIEEEERARILKALEDVDEVYITTHQRGDADRSVNEALRTIQPDIFANGGDRESTKDIPEAKLCEELGIKMVFGLGSKIQSSSWLTSRICAPVVQKPWGHMQTYRTEKNWWLKTLTVMPGKRMSLQSHEKRDELWVVVEGEMLGQLGDRTFEATPFQVISVKKGEKHRVTNTGKEELTLVEVACGPAFENDIVRYEDDFGRA